MKAYRGKHHHALSGLIILKTSRFAAAEVDGMLAAAEEAGVPENDPEWVSEGGHQTVVREGDYPPLRESTVRLGPDLLLFTRGSVSYYQTYPGKRILRPLLLRLRNCDTSIGEFGAEITALTKMNWNTTQFDRESPIPSYASRKVGKVLKHFSTGQTEQSDYRYYT